MTKTEIIKKYIKLLKSKTKFLELAKSGFFNYVKQEKTFQFFVVETLKQHGFEVITMNFEGNRTPFERFEQHFFGNQKGVSDIFVTTSKSDAFKGVFIELKKGYSDVFLKSGLYKKCKRIEAQRLFLEARKSEGYAAMFCYPENLEMIFDLHFNIKINENNL